MSEVADLYGTAAPAAATARVRFAVVDHTTIMYYTFAPSDLGPPFEKKEAAAGVIGRISKEGIEEAAWLNDVSSLSASVVVEATKARQDAKRGRRD